MGVGKGHGPCSLENRSSKGRKSFSAAVNDNKMGKLINEIRKGSALEEQPRKTNNRTKNIESPGVLGAINRRGFLERVRGRGPHARDAGRIIPLATLPEIIPTTW